MFNGQILKELRLLNDMSRSELAKKSDLTEQAIWQFETNRTAPKLATQWQLANVFNVAIDYFSMEEVSHFDLSSIAFRNADTTVKKNNRYSIGLSGQNGQINFLSGEFCSDS